MRFSIHVPCFYGFLLGLLILLIHLAQLESFGMPYLMPFVGADLNDYRDERDDSRL